MERGFPDVFDRCMVKMESTADDWSYFDKIYCISLEERPDRRQAAERQFARIGLKDRIDFFTVKKHPTDCEAGIYESHMACIRQGLQGGAEHVVVFEDDILFDRFSPQRLRQCIDFLRSTPDWDVFFFGCLISGSRRTRYRSVREITYRSLTHAYVLHRRFAEHLLKQPWRGIAYDAMLRSMPGRFFAVSPTFAFQSNSPTENKKYLWLDRFRRLCGGLQRIQKRNEWYCRYRPMLVAGHIVMISLILLWFFRCS